MTLSTIWKPAGDTSHVQGRATGRLGQPRAKPSRIRTSTVVLGLILCALVAPQAVAEGADARLHAIAMHGSPALPPGFDALPYVRADAPKGGRLRMGLAGTFDNLNPFTIRGVTVANVRGYVYESLMVRSADEPFSLYGLIAESISLPSDRSSITFYLRDAATFSDGKPITAEDVAFSHDLLSQYGPPYMRSHYRKVSEVTVLDAHTIQFKFAASGDREIPLILALMPILPRHLVAAETFEQTTLEPPIGSGPYRVTGVDAGRSVTFTRNPEYWARDLPIRRGLFNFDEIRLEYFRDSTALFEAFKSGALDFRYETDPVRWAEGYRFPAVRDGRVIQTGFKTGLPAGLRALVFNTRRPVFSDVRVREALIELFDFEWINRSLFNGLYERSNSLFARSTLAAAGQPASERERRMLGKHLEQIDPAILDGTWELPVANGSGRDRRLLRSAVTRLREAGYQVVNGQMVHAETKRPLAFEFLARTKAQERLMLAFKTVLDRVGITVTVRQVDDAQYWQRLKTFDFDMIQWRWPASLSPGNEQIHRWNSRFTDVDGSLNFAGARSPAVDAMIDVMLAADGQDDFEAAVRAFDRAVLSGRYVIPLFHAPTRWVAYWSHLKRPEVAPLFGIELNAWWAEDKRR